MSITKKREKIINAFALGTNFAVLGIQTGDLYLTDLSQTKAAGSGAESRSIVASTKLDKAHSEAIICIFVDGEMIVAGDLVGCFSIWRVQRLASTSNGSASSAVPAAVRDATIKAGGPVWRFAIRGNYIACIFGMYGKLIKI